MKSPVCRPAAGSPFRPRCSTAPARKAGNPGAGQRQRPGLPKEALRLVFDPFVVRSDSPMEYGIHLMACYFIVHHHGGRIEARSEAGQGTTFTLRLPVNPTRPSRPRTKRSSSRRSCSTRRSGRSSSPRSNPSPLGRRPELRPRSWHRPPRRIPWAGRTSPRLMPGISIPR